MSGFTNGHDHHPLRTQASANPPQGMRPSAGAFSRGALHSDQAVGQAVRDLRRAQHRTQKDLAQVVGVTGAQLHRYETGGTRIAASRLIAIAQALGVGASR